MLVAMSSADTGAGCGVQAATMKSTKIPIAANWGNRVIKSSFLKRWSEYIALSPILLLQTLRGYIVSFSMAAQFSPIVDCNSRSALTFASRHPFPF
jgi:hypothetical protein